MFTRYKDFIIEIFNEQSYEIGSVDNLKSYHFEYCEEASSYEFCSKYGIKLTHQANEISSALICGSGGNTTIHETSYVVKNDVIYICCGQQLYSLDIPSLSLKWSRELDFATCFEIYEFENDFIVHGEMEISRVTAEGIIKWKFSARDIFVSSGGEKEFEIVGDLIRLRDWQGYEYTLDANGKEIS